MTEEILSIGKAARLLSVSAQMLRNWDNERSNYPGKPLPIPMEPGKTHRRYRKSDILDYLQTRHGLRSESSAVPRDNGAFPNNSAVTDARAATEAIMKELEKISATLVKAMEILHDLHEQTKDPFSDHPKEDVKEFAGFKVGRPD